MNMMGNIFTTLIFFMSTIFLVVAVMVGASDRKWINEVSTLRQQADSAKKAVADVRKSTDKKEKYLESERVGRALQLANLESQLKALSDQLGQVRKQLASSTQTSQKRLAELEQASRRIVELDKELDGLKSANTQLVDDIANQFQTVRNLTNEVFEANNQIATLTKTKNGLTAQLAKTDKVLKQNGLNAESLTDHIEPKVEAVVATVYPDGLFSIIIGRDDGLRIGHEMDIFRRNQLVGKGRVVEAKDNVAVLKAIKGLMNDKVREGDNVSTKL